MILDDYIKSLGVVTVACAFFWNNADKKKQDEQQKEVTN